MATLKLRDRDGIVTKEGLIFRVFGYSHPRGAYICDAEYASADIFQSSDPRALRNGGTSGKVFYKFYDDEGWKFVHNNYYPQYTLMHKMLGVKVVGIKKSEIADVRLPKRRLKALVSDEPADSLIAATLRVLEISLKYSGLKVDNFGVFGSMLHGFHHPDYSDIDLLVYGGQEIAKMREVLGDLYSDGLSGFRNEFATSAAMAGKKWRFKHFTVKEFMWHQKRKLIYGLYDDRGSGRTIKAEFEPVKEWSEISSEYNSETKIVHKSWVRVKARVTADVDAPYIPSVYGIEPLEVLKGSKKALEAVRVVSYMEEFRLQARKDETIIVEGTLEEVTSPKGNFYQITLTYCPKYYDQTLKVADLRL
ncbi:MAG: nucleotidyltransferase domain-containing protein [Candidatus Bathyarchaeota archaeon]|nr:nucleotidyltransferase domain-containing protein [Candidatus Bathyarchaeota archaeon]